MKDTEKKTHTLGIAFPIKLYHTIRKLAYLEQRTFGMMIRILCEEALAKRSKQ